MVAAILLFLGGTFFALKNIHIGTDREPVPTVDEQAERARPEAVARRRAFHKQLAQVRRFRESHPDDLEAVRASYETLLETAPDEAARETVNEDVARIDVAISARERAMEEQQKRVAARTLKQARNRYRGQIAESLLAFDLNGAQARLAEAATEKAWQEAPAQLNELREAVDAVAGMGERIMAGFETDMGKVIEVQLRNGSEKGTVVRVESGAVTLRQELRKGGKPVGYSEKVLRTGELSLAEMFKRLGDDEDDSCLLVKGLLAHRAQKKDMARAHFRRVRNPMGKALLRRLL
jgi:hypothetical protein